MHNLINRQAAINELKANRLLYCDETPESFSELSYGDKCRVDEIDNAIATLLNLPSEEPEYKLDEWCMDCKEYDHKKHRCPRFNRVIRRTVDECTANQFVKILESLKDDDYDTYCHTGHSRFSENDWDWVIARVKEYYA